MLKKREMLIALIAVVIMSLIISFNNLEVQANLLPSSLAFSFIIIFLGIAVKKYVSRKIDVEIEIKIIPFQRWWYTRRAQFKKPIPGGIIFPLLLLIISKGVIKDLAFLSFSSKALPPKAAKKYGIRRFSGIMDWDDALIAFWSLVAVMLLAVVSKIISFYNLSDMLVLSKYSLYYVVWNLLPFGQIDGSKILFGSKPLYVLSLILTALTFVIVFF